MGVAAVRPGGLEVAQRFGLPGVTVNVRDEPVRGSLMTLTTLEPPVQALVSLWTDQHYGEQMRAALDLLTPHADHLAAYLVTESVPMRPGVALGQRSPGLANIAPTAPAGGHGRGPPGFSAGTGTTPRWRSPPSRRSATSRTTWCGR